VSIIKHISYYLPPKKLNNQQLSALFPQWSTADIFDKTGIKERSIADDEMVASDLAEKAAVRLFEEMKMPLSSIDFLIFCTQSPDYAAPTTACLLQERLGLSKHIGALDINLGCTGFLYGLSLAKGLLATQAASNILLLTAETLTKYLHPKDKSTRILFGDAAAATLISQQTKEQIGQFVFGTDGKGGHYMMRENGGFRQPYNRFCGLDYTDEYGNTTNPDFFAMKGANVLLFSLRTVPKLVATTLKKNQLTFDDIDLFVFHQANGYLLESLRKKMTIPKEKFWIYIEKCGNTVSSSVPIALAEAMKAGKAMKGNKVLLAAFGVGLSWAATVIEI